MFGNKKNFLLLITSVCLMSACVAINPPAPSSNKVNVATTQASTSTTAETAKPSKPGGGGYYQDDGPCSNPPADLDSRPDAQPRSEAFLSGPNRPYVALGQRYVPEVSMRAFRQTGKASWYGCKYQGQTTSSGEVFDTYQMTAAHPILPIPSYVRVTNLENQKSVVVRINDRGPFVANRVIDLSYLAARRIGLVEKGTADVEVERILPLGAITPPAPPIVAPSQTQAVIPSQAVAVIPPAPVVAPTPVVAAAQVQPATVTPPVIAPVVAQKPVSAEPVKPVSSSSAPPTQAKAQVFLQFGAFLDAAKAEQERLRLTQKGGWSYPINVVTHSGLYKIVMGPFPYTQQAEQEKMRLLAKKVTTFVVVY